MKIAELLLAKTGNAHRHTHVLTECASVCVYKCDNVCVCTGICRECVNYLGKQPNAFQDEFLLRVYARHVIHINQRYIYVIMCI